MGLARKMKRRERQALVKRVTNEAKTAITAQKKAEDIIKANDTRLGMYCKCRLLPSALYVMRKEFGWSCAQLIAVADKYQWFSQRYFIDGIRAGKVYLTVPWLWDGLKEECNMKYIKLSRGKEAPDDLFSVDEWSKLLAHRYSVAAMEYIETIWLWVLHTEFGFSRKRLCRFRKALAELEPLEMEIGKLYEIMAEIESCHTKDRRGIEFKLFRKWLKELDLAGDGLKGGLALAMGVAA